MNPEEPIQPSQPVGVLPARAEGAEIEVGPDDIEVMIDSILDNVLSQFDANVEPLLELLVEEENEPDQVKERLVNQSAYLLSSPRHLSIVQNTSHSKLFLFSRRMERITALVMSIE